MDCRFHVYQYMMYTLAMWNSYLFVSALDMFVVVLAGLISIFTARRSQKAIEKVIIRTGLPCHACSSIHVLCSGSRKRASQQPDGP